jgi:predicted RNase H-like HicB family nuclease
MVRHYQDYDYDADDDFDPEPTDELEYEGELDFEDAEGYGIAPDSIPGEEDDVEISMEIDADGREVWYAEDPKIPGSSSIGNSAEEAVDGMEDRRREYREMLRQSRDGEEAVDDIEQIPEPEHTGEHEVQVSMEVDEKGNELWYAKDPRVPGSESIGHSAEEAVDGLEDRRKKYREILRKSREQKKGNT